METIYTLKEYIYEFFEYYFFEKSYDNENFILIKNDLEDKNCQKEVDKIINDTIYEIKVEKEIKLLQKRYETLVKDCEIINNNQIEDDDNEDNNNNNNGKIALLI
jgi:hypothetical protein